MKWLGWLLLLPFPAALPLMVVMCVTLPFSAWLERRRECRYNPGLPPPRVVGRAGYRGWAWHVEDGRAGRGE